MRRSLGSSPISVLSRFAQFKNNSQKRALADSTSAAPQDSSTVVLAFVAERARAETGITTTPLIDGIMRAGTN
jgi:hypothetical protein